MGLFSGLEAFGFKTSDMKVFAAEKTTKPVSSEEKEEKKEVVIKEEDCLFPKTYQCPVCDKEFKTLAVRAGKIRTIGQDDDLRPLYKEMDPLKYDAIVCPHCGYAALSRYFGTVMPIQGKKLRAEVKANFTGMELPLDVFSYDEAIMHYKMVLMCDVIGNVKGSRKAYTCLKLAWVIRGKLEKEGEKMSLEERKKYREDEMECIQNAYDGYVQAFSSENFPMGGMDEITVTFLNAQLAYKLGKYRESLQLLSRVLGNKSVSSRIKDKALDLKEKIREQIQKKNN